MRQTPSAPKVAWELAWSDDFDGARGAPPDSAKWGYDLGDGCGRGICGWGNSEKEFYTSAPENIALTGQGQLAVTARIASGPTCGYGPCRYTSARITTRGRMSAAPGRVEARIKLPAGQGLWPAFWMLGDNLPAVGWPESGELDIMENRGSQPHVTSSAVHGPNYAGSVSFNRTRASTRGAFSADFHTFAIEWDSTGVQFFVDDIPSFGVGRAEVEQKGRWVFDQPFHVILNVAVGGHFDGDPASDAIFPATMFVDYVRVYRKR